MNATAFAECAIYVLLLLALAWPLGAYMARVYNGQALWAQRVIGPLERFVYRICGVDSAAQMDWRGYAYAVLAFNLFGLLAVYALQRVQASLPLNPAALANVAPEVAWNTAVSFASNTNWQAYGGETTLSHLTQMLALTTQNFVSAGTGMAVLVALLRGLTGRLTTNLGSFWVDLTRSTLYILLPLSVLLALLLVSQGVVQTFSASTSVPWLDRVLTADGKPVVEQVLALGPAASQIAIKQLGTNGGGFFNVNSAHPFENTSVLSNLLQALAILLLPAALCITYGRLVGSPRQGIALLLAMFALFLPVLALTVWSEHQANPLLTALGVDPSMGNWEGKETRFGLTASALWATATTAASNGSVNAMHDSFMPLGSLGPMWLMQLGEIVFGGVGSGIYGILMYAFVAVFVAGLMVGRTPEYLGKKIEAFEMKMAALVILLPSAAVLLGTALACSIPAGTQPLGNPGAHGFSEILYAFSSGANNNGSALGGLTVNGLFYTVAIGVCMLVGRYWVIVPVLALAGSLANKRAVPPSAGTLPTHTPLFILLLVGTIVIVGALTFIPALVLGPIVEHLSLR